MNYYNPNSDHHFSISGLFELINLDMADEIKALV